jgi:alpha-galactosidase
MTTWSELLRAELGIPYLEPSGDPVPFGLPPVPGSAWTAGELRRRDGDWQLEAGTGHGLEATFSFRFFPDTRAVECWGEVVNRGSSAVQGIGRSLTLDTSLRLSPGFGRPWVRSVNGNPTFPAYFPPDDFAVRDRQIVNAPGVIPPLLILSSASNGRTSQDSLPCLILGDESGTEGLAFMLEWSGLWSIELGRTIDDPPSDEGGLPIRAGIWGLSLDLQPGQALPLPRLLIAAYDGDLQAGGNALRRHIRRHVTPSLGGREVLPPVSFNQWCLFANDFTAEILKPAVDASAAAGLEYFCTDSGWFRGGFSAGVGNWDDPDPAKFPDGIRAFADYVSDRGLEYGLWFEPERAHLESDLYRAHPDWFRDTPPRPPVKSPQLRDTIFEDPDYALLDFGLPEVQEWWIARIIRAYDEWRIRWIRWDFNINPRPNWEHGVPAGQVGWAQIGHVQGLYRVLDEILAACPELLLEQCASGGHRIDLGTVRRGHTFWENDITDHTDIVRALQHGLNTVLPGNYANAQIFQPRHDFTDYDFLSHGAGGFGYGGRLWEAPKADFERYRTAVERFKGYRHLLLGDYERPTGVPGRADEYARVVFSDGDESVSMEFNVDGPGTTRFVM